MPDESVTGLKIKLNLTTDQKANLHDFCVRYAMAVNFSARKILELRDQFEETKAKKIDDKWVREIGVCKNCNKRTEIFAHFKAGRQSICWKCYKAEYSDYAIRKKLVPTKKRAVAAELDVTRVVDFPQTTFYHYAVRDAYNLLKAMKRQRQKRKQFLQRLEAQYKKFLDLQNGKNAIVLPKIGRQRSERYVHESEREFNKRGYTKTQIGQKIKVTDRNIKRLKKSFEKTNPITFRGTKIPLNNNAEFNLERELVAISAPTKTWFSFFGPSGIVNEHGKRYFEEKLKRIKPKKYCFLLRKENKDGTEDFYLQYPITVSTELIKPNTVMGIDRGSNTLAVLSILSKEGKIKKVLFIKKPINELKIKMKKQLWHMRFIRHRDKKIKNIRPIEPKISQLLHAAAKEIISLAEEYESLIVLEKIEGLKGQKAKFKQRKQERYRLSLFTYKKLQAFIEYKAKEKGLPLLGVPPEFTSKDCSHCGEKAATHRPYNNNFSIFHCDKCGITLNADYNASVNIAKKALNRI